MNRQWHILVAFVAVLALMAGALAVRFFAEPASVGQRDAAVPASEPCVPEPANPPLARDERALAQPRSVGTMEPNRQAGVPSDMTATPEPNHVEPESEFPLHIGPNLSVRPPEPPQETIDIFLVDAERRPVAGFVALEGAILDANAEPATSFSIPEPRFQPRSGLLGSACDVSGTLGRRFLWRKGVEGNEMTVVLESGATLVGRVVGVDRRPIADARVSLETLMLDDRWSALPDTLHTTVIDDEGYFQIDGVFAGPRIRGTAFLGTLGGRSRSLDLTPSEIADLGEIVLTGREPGSGIIQGRITDEEDLPVAHRTIQVGIERTMQAMVTDAEGYYTLTNMPTDRPVRVTIEVPGYGKWSRTAMADDFDCDFQLVPQGWDALGHEAPLLFAQTWFNHDPVILSEARGQVILLTFRNFRMDRDPGLESICRLLRDLGSEDLLVIAVYDHLSAGGSLAIDVITTHITSLFEGMPIAGMLDADPDLVADLMPPGQPPGVSAGATHWLYQVHERPASFLIDKKGIVRYCVAKESDLRDKIERLLQE